jgi:hypothetical protein
VKEDTETPCGAQLPGPAVRISSHSAIDGTLLFPYQELDLTEHFNAKTHAYKN